MVRSYNFILAAFTPLLRRTRTVSLDGQGSSTMCSDSSVVTVITVSRSPTVMLNGPDWMPLPRADAFTLTVINPSLPRMSRRGVMIQPLALVLPRVTVPLP